MYYAMYVLTALLLCRVIGVYLLDTAEQLNEVIFIKLNILFKDK